MVRLDSSINCILHIILESLEKQLNFNIIVGMISTGLLKFLSYIYNKYTCDIELFEN